MLKTEQGNPGWVSSKDCGKKKALSDKYKKKHIHFSSHPKKTVNSYRGRFMNTLSVTEDFRDTGVAEMD